MSASEPKKITWFDANRLRIMWAGLVSVVGLVAGIAAIYDVFGKGHESVAKTEPLAKLTSLTLGERVSRYEYMTRKDYDGAADPMHTSASPLSARERAQMGTVMYYGVDVTDARPYDVKYEPWDRNRHPLAEPRELRGILFQNPPFHDFQPFWIADDPKIAGIRLILAPNVPPPLLADFRTVHADGTSWIP